LATTKTSPPITPAVAAHQAEWHARQAADFFAESTKQQRPKTRELCRRRFIANAKLALPSLGLDQFLATFNGWLQRQGHFGVGNAEPIIRELAIELAVASPGGPVVHGDNVERALVAVQSLLAVNQQQVDAALRLVREAKPANVAEVETRRTYRSRVATLFRGGTRPCQAKCGIRNHYPHR
jgi:hypothetical protein